MEKWVSDYALQHELFDTWSRNLMIVNTLSAAITVIYPPSILLTGPLNTITNILGKLFSGFSFLFYFMDYVDAKIENSEDGIAAAKEGMFWSGISFALSFITFSESKKNVYFGIIDSIVQCYQNRYEIWKGWYYDWREKGYI